jgi:hypothetical protein
MKNSKITRFLLWFILAIALLPVILQLFIPGIPEVVILAGLIVSVSSALALILKKGTPPEESKAPGGLD